uniref:TPR repeat n=1 Tax=Chlorobium chlorochromatii (strain CaD3) TaxID=340177 RepID=Q3AQH8_CHLCH
MLKDALGSYRGSLAELNKMVEVQPHNAELWFARANERSGCGDYAGAISDYTTALLLGLRFREAVNAYGNRGMARLAMGDMRGAMEDFSTIIARQPKNRSLLRTAYLKRAHLREKQGDEVGAQNDRKAADCINGK